MTETRNLVYFRFVSKRRPSLISALKNLVPRGARILVAVSGGRDSMALLHGICAIRTMFELLVEVSHVDHRLRDGSAEDALFVKTFAARLLLECHLDVLASPPPGHNIEAWARGERYRIFAKHLSERSLDWCLTAHNANDVAETLLMRLIANKGFGSIEEIDEKRRCLRPLLAITRTQINSYVQANSIAFVEDPTNSDMDFTRNKIRLQLIPFLEREFDASVVWSLAERARAMASDESLLSQLALDGLANLGTVNFKDLLWVDRKSVV